MEKTKLCLFFLQFLTSLDLIFHCFVLGSSGVEKNRAPNEPALVPELKTKEKLVIGEKGSHYSLNFWKFFSDSIIFNGYPEGQSAV